MKALDKIGDKLQNVVIEEIIETTVEREAEVVIGLILEMEDGRRNQLKSGSCQRYFDKI